MERMQQPPAYHAPLTHGFTDDFDSYTDAQRWTAFGDAGSNAVSAATEGGVLVLTSGVFDNDQRGTATTNKLWKFRANGDLEFRARINFTESNTTNNYANVGVGFSSDFGVDTLLDNGAGADANHSGALIYKKDGGTKWVCHTSVGTVQTETLSAYIAMPASGEYDELVIKCTDQGGGTTRVTFFANERQLHDANSLPIAHTVTHADAAAMAAGAIIKAGSAAAETLNVDVISSYQNRP